jgi:DNA polymerase-3 subunit epsilon
VSWLQDGLQKWRRARALAALSDPQFAFLWDAPPPDEYVSLDCEMSCLDPKRAEIISIAAIIIKDQRIFLSEKFNVLVKPAGKLDPASIPVHGLRQQDVADGLPLCSALAQLLRFIGPRPIVGYYLEFDLAVIQRHLQLGVALPNQLIDISGLFYDRMVSAYRPEVDLSLSHILHTLDIPDLPRHDPVNDALLAAMAFLKLQPKKKGGSIY